MLSNLLKYHNVRQSLEEFLETNNYDKLNELIQSLSVKELGIVLQKLSSDKLRNLINIFPNFIKYEWFQNFNSDLQNELLNVISIENLKKVLNKLSYDELFKIYTCLSIENQKKILSLITMDEAGAIHIKKKYIDFEVGDILSLNYIVIPLFWTVKKAKELISKDQRYYNCNYKILVTNEKLEITGYILVSKLLVAQDNIILEKIVNRNVDSINIENCGIENLIRKISDDKLDFVVILDPQNKLIGTISAVDALSRARKSLLKHNDNNESLTFVENSSKYFQRNALSLLCAIVLYFVYFFIWNIDNIGIFSFATVIPVSFAYTLYKILHNFRNEDFSCENFLKPFSALCTNVIIISILVFGIVTPIENLNRGILLSVIVFANTIVSFKFVIIAKLLNVKNKKIMRFDWELLMPFVIVMNLLVVLSAIRYSY